MVRCAGPGWFEFFEQGLFGFCDQATKVNLFQCDTIFLFVFIGADDMPLSLRLPAEVGSQIASYSARSGLSKSAVIVRSIEEFLAKNAQPSAYQLYLDAMASMQPDNAPSTTSALRKNAPDHKLAIQKALQRKHKDRSARAVKALQSAASKGA